MKVGILSDTHGLLRPEMMEVLSSCDLILHGGDFHNERTYKALSLLKPLRAVRGNNDKEWAHGLPQSLSFSVEGFSFFMTHRKQDVPKDLGQAQVVIFGHSHQYFQQWMDGRLWLNPGSCGRRRFDYELTFVVLSLQNGEIQVEKRTLHP